MQVEAQHSIPFFPHVLQVGDVLVLRYRELNVVKRKYLVLSTSEKPDAPPRAFCVVLYADRYVSPGDSMWIDLECMPLEMCLIERRR